MIVYLRKDLIDPIIYPRELNMYKDSELDSIVQLNPKKDTATKEMICLRHGKNCRNKPENRRWYDRWIDRPPCTWYIIFKEDVML